MGVRGTLFDVPEYVWAYARRRDGTEGGELTDMRVTWSIRAC